MERQIAAFKLLGILLLKQRNQLKELEREHRRITGLVDSFYGLLGRRNWVFTGDLSLPAIEHVVDIDDGELLRPASTATTRKGPDRLPAGQGQFP